ncbi:MAG: hypothetical protein ABFC98_01310 [Candidatus Cloacimonas sp.]
MTNTARNTLVLASLLIVTGAITYAINNSRQSKLNEQKAKNKDLTHQIANIKSMMENREELERERNMQIALASQRSKAIIDVDTPTITYDYLLRILQWMDKDIIYDFAISGKGDNKEGTSGTFNEYVLSGKSNYLDFVDFTRNLEYQRALITIEDISLAGTANNDTIDFSVVFRTHYQQGGVPISELTAKKIEKYVAAYQLFKPRIHENIPDYDIDTRLTDIDNSTLIAITENKAFIRDNKGIIRIFSPGDRVLWGYLYQIDAKEGRAIFKVNKYGYEEDQVLTIIKEK